MKKTIFELVSSIQQDLNNNNSSKGNNIEIPEDISQKYINFKKWLDENGTIYPKLNFPVKFNNIFGCEATEDIKENSCIFYIPYKLLIDSSNIKYDFLPQSLKDNNTIKLVLFLLEEYNKKEKSFYKPYIDLILINDFKNYTPFWSRDDLLELNDDMVEENINYYMNEIIDYYDDIVEKSRIKIDFMLFKLFYVFVFSRQFNIGDDKMLLIPLADLLNHSPYADIKYEFLDSKNMIMKYTSDFNDNNNLSKDIISNNLKNYTDFSDFFKYYNRNKIIDNNVNNNEIKIINVNYDEDEEKNYELTNDDYFVISTNSQIFKKGSQIFNNYGICSNEYLLVNLGFCLIDNPGDKTKVVLNIIKPENYLKKFLEKYYLDDFLNKDSYIKDKIIKIRLYVKRNKISKKILNIIRYEIYKEPKKFEKKLEIECLNKYINFINSKIEMNNISPFKLINNIKEMIYKTGIKDENKFNITVFKLTQKLNLLYQKEVINNMINILNHDEKNEIINNETFLKYVEKYESIKSIYLKKEDIKNIVIYYLNKNKF
jgi:hypothetical protein